MKRDSDGRNMAETHGILLMLRGLLAMLSRSGRGGRRFESSHSDQKTPKQSDVCEIHPSDGRADAPFAHNLPTRYCGSVLEEWRSIETCPQDGTWFLAFSPARGGTYSIARPFERAANGFENFWQTGGLSDLPTHWMPLYKAPENAPESSAAGIGNGGSRLTFAYDVSLDTLHISPRKTGSVINLVDTHGIVIKVDASAKAVGATIACFNEVWSSRRTELSDGLAFTLRLPPSYVADIIEKAVVLANASRPSAAPSEEA